MTSSKRPSTVNTTLDRVFKDREATAADRDDERVSLHPLDPEDALRALLATPKPTDR